MIFFKFSHVNKASVTFPRTSHVLSLESTDSSPGPPEQTALDNHITSQPWSDEIWPLTTPSTGYFHFVTLFSVHFGPTSQDKVQKGVVRGQVASDHGWPVILSRPSCSKGDETGFEAIRGREPSTARPQHLAIFWDFCGNFRMSRRPLQKLPRRIRYQKRTEQIFCTRSKKRHWKSVLTFRTQHVLDSVFEVFRSTLNYSTSTIRVVSRVVW